MLQVKKLTSFDDLNGFDFSSVNFFQTPEYLKIFIKHFCREEDVILLGVYGDSRHPEERSDEGSLSAKGKRKERKEILRCTQDDNESAARLKATPPFAPASGCQAWRRFWPPAHWRYRTAHARCRCACPARRKYPGIF